MRRLDAVDRPEPGTTPSGRVETARGLDGARDAGRPGEVSTAASRWLVVVRRDQAALYSYLRRGFTGVGLLDVILDRRQGRGHPGEPGTRPLPDDRRRPVRPRERSRWRSLGYVLVEVPPDADEPVRR